MHFSHPWAAWLFLTVPAAVLLYAWALRPRRMEVPSLLLWDRIKTERRSSLWRDGRLWLLVFSCALSALAGTDPRVESSGEGGGRPLVSHADLLWPAYGREEGTSSVPDGEGGVPGLLPRALDRLVRSLPGAAGLGKGVIFHAEPGSFPSGRDRVGVWWEASARKGAFAPSRDVEAERQVAEGSKGFWTEEFLVAAQGAAAHRIVGGSRVDPSGVGWWWMGREPAVAVTRWRGRAQLYVGAPLETEGEDARWVRSPFFPLFWQYLFDWARLDLHPHPAAVSPPRSAAPSPDRSAERPVPITIFMFFLVGGTLLLLWKAG
jgi:hypothetical protein